ncbi:MAG: Cna B-type domain-containing protein [Clostridia bacterium]|nr:Cna B-type domain-containing protein [Clostridia bacterium]
MKGKSSRILITIAIVICAIFTILDKSSIAFFNIQKREVQQEAENTKQIAAAHVHTDACWDKVNHICTGNENQYGGCYVIRHDERHYHQGQPGLSYSNGCYTIPTYHNHTEECWKGPNCNHDMKKSGSWTDRITGRTFTVGDTINPVDHGDIYGCNHSPTITGVWYCDSCNTINGFILVCDEDRCFYNNKPNGRGYGKAEGCTTITGQHKMPNSQCEWGNNTVVYNDLGCGYSDGQIIRTWYTKDCKYNPMCDRIIVSVRPKYPVQSLQKPSQFNDTLIVTYMDGHTQELRAGSTTFDRERDYNAENITASITGIGNQNYQNHTFNTTINITTDYYRNVAGNITWNDLNNRYNSRVRTILKLYRRVGQGGAELVATQTTAVGQTSYTFSGVKKFDSNENDYTYYVEQDNIAGYETINSGLNPTGHPALFFDAIMELSFPKNFEKYT